MKMWGGFRGNIDVAQTVVRHRARMNGLAAEGRYKLELENAA